jgi:hypothetical protein
MSYFSHQSLSVAVAMPALLSSDSIVYTQGVSKDCERGVSSRLSMYAMSPYSLISWHELELPVMSPRKHNRQRSQCAQEGQLNNREDPNGAHCWALGMLAPSTRNKTEARQARCVTGVA